MPNLSLAHILNRLPADASPTSHDFTRAAVALAHACPPALAAEIALIGSTARGAADDSSDIELLYWNADIPPQTDRVASMQAVGLTALAAEDTPRADGSVWITGLYSGDETDAPVEIEISWQTFERLDGEVRALTSGDVTDRKRLAMADYLVQAIALRTDGAIDRVQAALNAYPDAVRRALATDALHAWNDPDREGLIRKLARRGEQVELARLLIDDASAALRLLYVINRRWEPSRKWTQWVARDLPRRPEAFEARLAAMLGAPPADALTIRLLLLDDLLALLPADLVSAELRYRA